jgi:hypothetical protein
MKKLTSTEQKYLNFLFELKKECSEVEEFGLTEFLTKNKISHVVGTILIKKGIIQNINNKLYPRYIWKTITPNIHMARAIYQETQKYHNEKRNNAPILTQEKPRKLIYAPELTLNKIETIIESRDVKNKSFSQIAKEVNYSQVHTGNIYHAAKGSDEHLKRMGYISNKVVLEYRKNINNQQKPTNQDAKTRMGAKINAAKQRNETVRVEPRMHPKLEQKTQKSIVIFWGLINIKF